MCHLQVTGFSYLQHLLRAWSTAFVLVIHGLFPNVWQNKASNMLETNHEKNSTDGSSSPDHAVS